MNNNDFNHYFIRMDDQKARKRNKNKDRKARKAAKKRSGSLSEHTEVLPQDATEVASSDEEEQWNEGESLGDALRAVPDEPELTNMNLSSEVSKEQFGVNRTPTPGNFG